MWMSTAAEVVKFVKDKQVKMMDFKFVDLPGIWQHYSIPAQRLTEAIFEEGIGFDGSSIRGFAKIQESDMLVFSRSRRLPFSIPCARCRR